jgi:hypothetical protein
MPGVKQYDSRDDCDLMKANEACTSSQRRLCPSKCFILEVFYDGQIWGTRTIELAKLSGVIRGCDIDLDNPKYFDEGYGG